MMKNELGVLKNDGRDRKNVSPISLKIHSSFKRLDLKKETLDIDLQKADLDLKKVAQKFKKSSRSHHKSLPSKSSKISLSLTTPP